MKFKNTFTTDKRIGKIGEALVQDYYSSLDYDVIDVSEIEKY